MTDDVKSSQRDTAEHASRPSAYSSMRKIFEVPGPVRQLFDRFPLRTYPANELPQRSPRRREEHSLYIFTTWQASQNGEPSFNPTCLKWQVRPAVHLCHERYSLHELTSIRHISRLQAFNSDPSLPQTMRHPQELSPFYYPLDRTTSRPWSLPFQ